MIFLNVPYAEKDQARALGARWNPVRKRWYVPDGVESSPFEKWLPAEAPAGAGRTDSAAASLALGANYVALGHDCNPFERCAECERRLAGSAWAQARAALAATIASLGRR
jgi:hypothetical protein